MRYRVKQIILLNGSQYIPQRKFLFFWIDIDEKNIYDTLDDADRFIAYYDLVRNKKNLIYHNLIPNYDLLQKDPNMTIDDVISYVENIIERKENDTNDPLPCGHLKTTLAVLKEIKDKSL